MSDASNFFAGVSQKASYASHIELKRDLTSFFSINQDFFNRGYHLVNIETFMEQGERFWAGIWHAASGAHWVQVDMDLPTLLAADMSWKQQGLAMTDVTSYGVDVVDSRNIRHTEIRWAAIWEQRSTPSTFLHELTIGAFAQQTQQLFDNQGLRLDRMTAHQNPNSAQMLWSGICSPSSVANYFFWDLDLEEVEITDNKNRLQNLHLIDIETYVGADGLKWAGIWRLSQGDTSLISDRGGLDLNAFAAAAQTIFNSVGERLVSLTVYPNLIPFD